MSIIRNYPVERNSTIEIIGPQRFLSVTKADHGMWVLAAVVDTFKPGKLVRIASYATDEETAGDLRGWDYVGPLDDDGVILHFFVKILERVK